MRKRRPAALSVAYVLLTASLAPSADRWVSRNGADAANDCLGATAPCRTIAHALASAASGDTIDVARGTYRESLRVESSTALTLLGGWDAGFTTRDPASSPSVIKGSNDRVWAMIAEAGETIDLTLDGFVLMKGRARTTLYDSFPIFRTGGAGIGVIAAGGDVTLTVRDTVIKNNRAASRTFAGNGGGLFVGGGHATVTLDRVLLDHNIAEYGGGLQALGFGPSAVTVTLVNCAVTRNRTRLGAAGVTATGFPNPGLGSLRVDSSTITANLAVHRNPVAGEEVEGAVSLGNAADGTITNSIVWGNSTRPALPGADVYLDSPDAVLALDHADVGDLNLEAGTLNDLGGNLSVDPLLTLLHLGAGSPMIDAGTCVGQPAVDRDGDARPTGSVCDIGADEFVP